MKRKRLFAVSSVLLLGLLVSLLYFRRESLEGRDSNGDGIRDDVEALIEAKYSSSETKSAARHFARTLQEAIVRPDATEEKAMTYAVDCLFFVAPTQAFEITEAIHAATANTYARTRALIKESSRFNGKILRGASSRAEACAFDPSLTK